MKNLMLYFSAFIPMYMLVLIRLVLEILNNNLHFNVLNTTCLIVSIVQIALGSVGLWQSLGENSPAEEIVIKDKKNLTDQNFLGYFALFVLFAMSLDLSLMSMYTVYVLVQVFIGVVYINSGLFYVNPMLNLLGYQFYEINFTKSGSAKVHSAKILNKGDFDLNKKCKVRLKNKNFAFIEKD